MTNMFATLRLIGLVMMVWLLGAPAAAQNQPQNQPSISLNSVLQYSLFENGRMRIGDTDIAFAPSSAPKVQVTVRKADGAKLQSFRFYDDYRMQQAVFGRVLPEGPAGYQFQPGDYALDFSVKGQLVTTVPFSVQKASTSADPFAPGSSYKWVGPWQKWAHLAPDSQRSGNAAAIFFWAGSNDVNAKSKRQRFIAKAYRNGKLIAHSKRGAGTITSKWMQRHKATFLQPHPADTNRTAPIVPLSELSKPGEYRIDVEVIETGEVFRSFRYTAAGGVITAHPRTQLGYQPQADYIFARAPDIRSSRYEWREVYWITN